MEFTELEVLSFLISAALVFLMVPGLALFYRRIGAPQERDRNDDAFHHGHRCGERAVGAVGATAWRSATAWAGGFVGDLTKFGMVGVGLEEQAFMVFQGMFAIITVALIAGGFAERFKFVSYIIFAALWVTIGVRPPLPLGMGVAVGWAIWAACWG